MPENRIILETPLRGGSVNTIERQASEALTPGELIEFGGSNEVQPHSTAAGNAQKLFCLKDEPEGGIGDDIASGDTATLAVCPTSTKVNGFLHNSSADINEGDALESDTSGNLVKAGTAAESDADDSVVGYAAEDVTSPASGRTRIQFYTA